MFSNNVIKISMNKNHFWMEHTSKTRIFYAIFPLVIWNKSSKRNEVFPLANVQLEIRSNIRRKMNDPLLFMFIWLNVHSCVLSKKFVAIRNFLFFSISIIFLCWKIGLWNNMRSIQAIITTKLYSNRVKREMNLLKTCD